MKELKKEIEVVENLIRLLQECFVISLRERQFQEITKILIDIKHCKKELAILVAKKEAELVVVKELQGDEVHRSGKNFSR